MRVIDADALIAEMHNIILEDGEDRRIFYEVIERQLTIEPKKGQWTRPFPTRPKTYERFCSECKGKAWYCGTGDYNFCPNCGADMRGEEE